MKDKKNRLSIEERKFINIYIENGGNGTRAFIEAFSAKKYTEKTCATSAHNILKKLEVKKAIEKRMLELEQSSAIRLETKRNALWDIACDGMQTEKRQISGQSDSIEKMVDSRTSVSAINELNKMDGHHAGQNIYVRSEQFVFGQAFDQSSSNADKGEKAVQGEVLESE